MATYVISQITLPNGDVCQLKDANPVAELPSVTGSDNGKALMVVNGEWAVDDIPVEEIPEELPTVTSSDNGKVLTVVSGEWAAATASGGNVTAMTDAEIEAAVDDGWTHSFTINIENGNDSIAYVSTILNDTGVYISEADEGDTVYFQTVSFASVTVVNNRYQASIEYSEESNAYTGNTIYTFIMPSSSITITSVVSGAGPGQNL